MRRRWWKPWEAEDRYGLSEGLSPGWQVALVVGGIFALGLLVQAINTIHMSSMTADMDRMMGR